MSNRRLVSCSEQNMLWDTTKASLAQILKIKRHRASGDAYLIQQTYMATRDLLNPPSPELVKTRR